MLRANAMSAAPATLSVVIASLNPGSRLPATLSSLREQRWVQPEIIIVERGSTDGTRAWLEAQASGSVTVISADGAGYFEALNRGIAAARHEWLLFLVAGDRLVGEVVLDETLNWTKKTEAGIVVGEAAFDDGRIVKLSTKVNAAARNFVPHSSTFYRRTLFEENDLFDTTLPTAADYEFHARLWKSHIRFKPIPLRIAACTTHEPVETHSWRAAREEMTVRHRYFSRGRCLWWDLASILRWLGRKLSPSR